MARFEDIRVGDELPAQTHAFDRLGLVKYAAGSGDFNPLHYDADFPQAREIGDNIVHGRLKYALLGKLVSDWLAGDGWVRELACEYRGMDLRGAPVTATGRVSDKRTEDGAALVELELAVVGEEGRVSTPGSATVVLTR